MSKVEEYRRRNEEHEKSEENRRKQGAEEEQNMTIRCINLTSINKQGKQIKETEGEAVFFQEHAAGKSIQGYWKKELKEAGWNTHMTPIGTKMKGAGVGCVTRQPIQAVHIKIKTKAMREQYEKGRCGIYIYYRPKPEKYM